MKSAVIINLDYERHGAQTCRRIWDEISQRMATAGFEPHFRMFLADMDRKTACRLAREVVSTTEDVLAPEGIIVFDVIREFYWFEYEQINDLLAPANDLPEVSIIQMDDFQQFLNAGNGSQ